jgi:phosphate transport system protein
MTRERYQQDLAGLEGQVAAMAALAREMLEGGVAALTDLDRARAAEVIARADELAQMDEDIETDVLQLITLQAPVAGDLRRLGAALKLITYLNRVGRYGYDIARACRDWPEGADHVARMVSLRDMAEKVQRMLGLAIDAYAKHEVPDIAQVEALESDVDAMRFSVWRECLTYMAQDPQNIEPCANYMMVARYLERSADNICKMAEKLHYAATGRRVLIG